MFAPGCARAQPPKPEVQSIDWTGIHATGFDYIGANNPTDSTRERGFTREQVSRLDPDLRKVRAALGTKEQLWTLQIAIYTRPDRSVPTPEELAEFKASAEEAVRQIRQDGDTAFYFHTEKSSTVTVGIFTNDDYKVTRKTDQGGMIVSSRGQTSAAFREVLERHPHNMVNGAGLRVRSAGGQGSLQPSFLVEVPKS